MSLGTYLRSLRGSRRLTLRAAEEQVGLSNAYLSQLESNKIRSPSPSALFKLSQLYDVPYDDLMRRAGYPMPGSPSEGVLEASGEIPHSRRMGLGPPSLNSRFLDITAEEEESLLEYLAFLRSRKKK